VNPLILAILILVLILITIFLYETTVIGRGARKNPRSRRPLDDPGESLPETPSSD
jgi:hypothetical protein